MNQMTMCVRTHRAVEIHFGGISAEHSTYMCELRDMVRH